MMDQQTLSNWQVNIEEIYGYKIVYGRLSHGLSTAEKFDRLMNKSIWKSNIYIIYVY